VEIHYRERNIALKRVTLNSIYNNAQQHSTVWRYTTTKETLQTRNDYSNDLYNVPLSQNTI